MTGETETRQTAFDGTRCGACSGTLAYDDQSVSAADYSSRDGRFNWTLTCTHCGTAHQHQCLDGVTAQWSVTQGGARRLLSSR